MFKIKVDCVLNKNIEAVFDIITDHGNYKQFPGINKSKLLEEGKNEKNGEGALRIIDAGLFKFRERITCFERPNKMHYLIEETNPIPMQHDKGEITLEKMGKKTRVLWLSEGHIKVPIIGGALDKLVEFQISKAFRTILNYIERSV